MNNACYMPRKYRLCFLSLHVYCSIYGVSNTIHPPMESADDKKTTKYAVPTAAIPLFKM